MGPVFLQYLSFFIFLFLIFPFISHRTYADKLSPKVVQSLLDLLCSQLKNLLSQTGVLFMASFGEGEEGEEEDKKVDSSGEAEKRDFRGSMSSFCFFIMCRYLCLHRVHMVRILASFCCDMKGFLIVCNLLSLYIHMSI